MVANDWSTLDGYSLDNIIGKLFLMLVWRYVDIKFPTIWIPHNDLKVLIYATNLFDLDGMFWIVTELIYVQLIPHLAHLVWWNQTWSIGMLANVWTMLTRRTQQIAVAEPAPNWSGSTSFVLSVCVALFEIGLILFIFSFIDPVAMIHQRCLWFIDVAS